MLTGQQKADAALRLRRIEGQVRGLAEMVEAERYCVDVLIQIAAVHEALRGVSKRIVENHLATCVTEAAQADDATRRDETLREFVETMYKFVR